MTVEDYRYWKDIHRDDGRELEIRTCQECKFSEVKTNEGDWVSYVTRGRIEYMEECYKNNKDYTKCESCKERLYNGWK